MELCDALRHWRLHGGAPHVDRAVTDRTRVIATRPAGVRSQRGHVVVIPAGRREDVVQDVTLVLWERRHDRPPDAVLDGPKEQTDRYVETMLANRWLSILRKDVREVILEPSKVPEPPPPPPAPSAAPLGELLAKVMAHAIDARPERYREALRQAWQDCQEMILLRVAPKELLRRRGVVTDEVTGAMARTLANKLYQQQHRLREAMKASLEALEAEAELDPALARELEQLIPTLDPSCQRLASATSSGHGLSAGADS